MSETHSDGFRQRLLDRSARAKVRQEAVRVRGKRFKAFRKHYGTLILGASLALGGAGIPLKASRVSESDLTPVRGTMESVNDRGLSAFSEREAERQLELISERAKEEFFATEVPFGDLIYRESKKHDIDPVLVAAVVHQESRFMPKAKSPVGAMGLMQLMPRTGRWMGARNLYDPAQNVKAGVKYLKYLQKRFGDDEELVLAAYNGGEGNVKRYGGVPPFRETRQYVRRVSSYRSEYDDKVAGRIAELVEETAPLLVEHLDPVTTR